MKFTPGGTESTFATGLNAPTGLTFRAALAVPEASTLPAVGAGVVCLTLLTLVQRRRRGRSGVGGYLPEPPA